MADGAIFKSDDARRIAAATVEFERRSKLSNYGQTNTVGTTGEWVHAWGKLTTTLARSGSATFQAYHLNPAGGLGSIITGMTFTIIDPGTMPSDISPLPIGTTLEATLADGIWVRGDYDCDAV